LGCPEIVVKGPSAIAIAIAAKLSFLSSSEDKTLQHSSQLIQYCYFQMLPRGRSGFYEHLVTQVRNYFPYPYQIEEYYFINFILFAQNYPSSSIIFSNFLFCLICEHIKQFPPPPPTNYLAKK
jgi:hypothetical protein